MNAGRTPDVEEAIWANAAFAVGLEGDDRLRRQARESILQAIGGAPDIEIKRTRRLGKMLAELTSASIGSPGRLVSAHEEDRGALLYWRPEQAQGESIDTLIQREIANVADVYVGMLKTGRVDPATHRIGFAVPTRKYLETLGDQVRARLPTSDGESPKRKRRRICPA